MKTAKIGAIFLISIMALAGASAGYALWSDHLYIDGCVKTGYIGAIWSVEGFGDSEPEEKDFSWVEAYAEENYLEIVVFNAYPCITYWVDINIENTGSIPIHVQDISWEYNDILGVGTFTVTWPDNVEFPVQIHPGEAIYGRIEIHLNNDAQQDEVYDFSGKLMYHQWNEIARD